MIEPGDRIGRYEVQRRLGRGGMGTVYLAHDPVLKRPIAIKVLSTDLDLPDARDRFHREATSAASVNHSNIVVVHELGEFASQPYIVMEYVVGESLADIIRRKAPVTLFEKLRWMDDLCAGVASAHQKRVLHRDIKPTNLMIDRSGRLKIVDFGIARILGTLGTNNSSRFAGTPGYMAPEQICGGLVDERADLFSIGAVCYELLSYTEAFPGETSHTISHRVLNEEPAPLLSVVPDIDPSLVRIVDRALAKRADDRFADVSSLGAAFAVVRRRIELQGIDTEAGHTVINTDSAYKARPSSRPSTPSASAAQGPSRRPTSSDGYSASRPSEAEGPHARSRSALTRARSWLEAGDIDAALTACEEALSLDEANPEALEIERAIRTASAERRARLLLADSRRQIKIGALDAAAELLQQARGLNVEPVECARVETELRIARGRRRDVPQGEDIEETILIPHRPSNSSESAGQETVVVPRPPTPAPPITPSIKPITPSIKKKTDFPPAGKQTPPRKPPTGPAAQVPDGGKRIPAMKPIVTSKPLTAAPAPQRASTLAKMRSVFAPMRSRALTGAAIAALVTVLAIVVAAFALRKREIPTGTLLVDAAPWGTVKAVTALDGTVHQLPEDASTPLLLTLPEGQYSVTIAPPDGNGDARTMTVEITAGGFARSKVESFPTISMDEYFAQYLTLSTQDSSAGSETSDALPVSGSQP